MLRAEIELHGACSVERDEGAAEDIQWCLGELHNASISRRE